MNPGLIMLVVFGCLVVIVFFIIYFKPSIIELFARGVESRIAKKAPELFERYRDTNMNMISAKDMLVSLGIDYSTNIAHRYVMYLTTMASDYGYYLKGSSHAGELEPYQVYFIRKEEKDERKAN